MLTDKRVNIKPVEYPEFVKYKDAMQQSYWLVTEYNYTEDIQDFHTRVNDAERGAIKNSMLAIAQVEVAVKLFWSKLYDWFPKPEISDMGVSFAEAEVRHKDAYSHLLELLGLNKEFEEIYEIPAVIDRMTFLDKYLVVPKDKDYKKFLKALILFSLFTEHVSLFSQFLIIKAFHKERNLFRGMSNAISATRAEEQLHGAAGIYLTNLLREEFPEWFDEELEEHIRIACEKAMKAEIKILDWIFEAGELDFLPRKTVEEFIKNRFNQDLTQIGFQTIFDVDESEVRKTLWFEEETLSSTHFDFFASRPTNYSLRTKSITEDDLF